MRSSGYADEVHREHRAEINRQINYKASGCRSPSRSGYRRRSRAEFISFTLYDKARERGNGEKEEREGEKDSRRRIRARGMPSGALEEPAADHACAGPGLTHETVREQKPDTRVTLNRDTVDEKRTSRSDATHFPLTDKTELRMARILLTPYCPLCACAVWRPMSSGSANGKKLGKIRKWEQQVDKVLYSVCFCRFICR